jgi:protein SCO1/2
MKNDRSCCWASRGFLALLLVFMLAFGRAGMARAQPGPPPDLSGVGFDQRLDTQAPLDLAFRDEAGRTVHLGDYFGAKPVILALAYYKCPNLCTLVLTQMVENLRKIAFDIGDQFNIVTVSIDPRETPAIASAKKATYLQRYGRAGADAGWHFLTGEQPAIQRLAQAIGFRYVYDAQLDQYMHPTGILVLTPAGKIARYFYGLDYAPSDLRLGLVEASAGKIGSPVDQIALFCYHYDPVTGRYDLMIRNMLWLAVGATVLALAAFVSGMLRRERRMKIGDSR